MRLLTEWIGKGKVVLDIGCRDGMLTRHVVENNNVIGIDIDRTALIACKERLRIEVLLCNAIEGLPFADASFDIVCCAEVLEHLPFPKITVREIARVLHAGGTFVGSIPNSFRLKNRLKFLMGRDFEVDPTHLRHFSPQSLRECLATAFTQIELRFVESRLLRVSPRLMGNAICFKAIKSAIQAI